MKRHRRWAVALVGAVAAGMSFAAGCGTGASGDERPAIRTPEIQAALRECEGEIRSNTEHGDAPITKAVRQELEQICDDAADGGVPELREAAKKVCARAVEETVPTGRYAFELSLKLCKSLARP